MTAYSIEEVKAHLAEISRDLNHGEEVIITRRGRPCSRLIAVDDCGADDKSSLATLRGALSQLPDAYYQDFRASGECLRKDVEATMTDDQARRFA